MRGTGLAVIYAGKDIANLNSFFGVQRNSPEKNGGLAGDRLIGVEVPDKLHNAEQVLSLWGERIGNQVQILSGRATVTGETLHLTTRSGKVGASRIRSQETCLLL